VKTAERCLLCLLDRVHVETDSPAAEELTQDRIADVIRDRREHVSRAMKNLRLKGLVRTVKIRAGGRTRKVTAYFLTDDGARRAREVRKHVEEMWVVVRDFSGRESKMRLYEVAALLPQRPRFSDLSFSVEAGRLDLASFLELQSRISRGKVFDVRGAISVPNFRGREEVLSRLDGFIEDDQSRAFLLLGLPGIGKTAVASRWIMGLQGRIHILWRRILPESTANDLIRDFALLLHAVGQPALLNNLQRTGGSSSDESIGILRRDMAGFQGLIVLDDAHAAKKDVERLLQTLTQAGPRGSGAKLLLISRKDPPFLRAEGVVRGLIWEEKLDDLPLDKAGEVLAVMGVEEGRRANILRKCGGHPLSLELAATGRLPLESIHLRSTDWLGQDVLPQLHQKARDALAFASVYGEPIPRSLLGAHSNELLRLCLVREMEDGRLDVHDLVKTAVIENLPPERLAELHRKAGEILAESIGSRETISALRHMLAGGVKREAMSLAVERGEEIVDGGLAESFLPLLDQLIRLRSNKQVESRLWLVKGHAMFALGRFAQAARAYGNSQKGGGRQTVAEALLGQGKAELERGSRLAQPLLLKVRRRLEGLGALRLLAETYYWIGGTYEDTRQLDKARDCFEKGRAIAFDVGDRRWEGLCVYGIGRVRSMQKDFIGAVEEEKEALRLLEREGRRLDIAKVCAGLGGNLYELKQYEEAERYLIKATSEARATGAGVVLTACLYNLSSVMSDLGRQRELLPLLEEALELNEGRENYAGASRCAAILAKETWTLGLEDLGESHMRRSDSLLRHVTEPASRAIVFEYQALACSTAGKMERARQLLVIALDEARKASFKEMEADLAAKLAKLS
jgi:tetratricopeptide (TPR) repeat protein